MSEQKDGRRYEVELDWWYVSKETLWRWFLLLIGAAVLVSGGVYWWLHRGQDVAGRARREIVAAEETLAKARMSPGAARSREEIDAAQRNLEEAEASFRAGRYPGPEEMTWDAAGFTALTEKAKGALAA